MAYKGMGRVGDVTTIDFGNRSVSFNAATIAVSGPRTIAKVEAAVNAYLDANKDYPGEVWRCHVYSLSPLNYAVCRFQHGGMGWTVPDNWWPVA